MITTIKDLKKTLESNFKDEESIYVLFFGKDEFDVGEDDEITDEVWLAALDKVDDDEEDSTIYSKIEDEIQSQIQKNLKPIPLEEIYKWTVISVVAMGHMSPIK